MAYWDVRDAVARVEGPRQAGRPTAAVIRAATRRHPRGYVGPSPSEKTNLSAGRAAYRGPERRGGGFGRLANGIRRPVYVFDAN